MRIIIPGGSGQVGQVLARHFHSLKHEVIVIGRNPAAAPWRVADWDGLSAGPWASLLEKSDVCINLAGRSVNCRYGAENRRAIYDSRIGTTRLLAQVIGTLKTPPRIWMNASTATIYRHSLDRAMDEATGELGGGEVGAPSTWNFSIKVAKDWEEAFFETPIAGTRKIALRSAMTFSPDRGGVFDEFLRLVRFGLGGTTGTGNQYVSWIHETDFIRAVEFLIEREEMNGPVNLAAPNPLPNRDFMRALRQAWGTGLGLPSAEWMVEVGTFLMRTESELVLKSRQVVPGRLIGAGFRFEFEHWPEAAKELVARWRR